ERRPRLRLDVRARAGGYRVNDAAVTNRAVPSCGAAAPAFDDHIFLLAQIAPPNIGRSASIYSASGARLGGRIPEQTTFGAPAPPLAALSHRRKRRRPQDGDGHLLDDGAVLLALAEHARAVGILGKGVELGDALVEALPRQQIREHVIVAADAVLPV